MCCAVSVPLATAVGHEVGKADNGGADERNGNKRIVEEHAAVTDNGYGMVKEMASLEAPPALPICQP